MSLFPLSPVCQIAIRHLYDAVGEATAKTIENSGVAIDSGRKEGENTGMRCDSGSQLFPEWYDVS